MSVAQTVASMSKFGVLMVCGPAAFLGSMQGARFYRNYTATEEEKASAGKHSDHLRKQSVADRLTTGGNVGHFNAKYLEKHLKTNSAMRGRADEIREAHVAATR
jgi:hypothetical protein